MLAVNNQHSMNSIIAPRIVTAQQVTTFGLGAGLCNLYEVNSFVQLQELLQMLKEQGQRYLILGAGSNVVLGDKSIEIPVIKFGRQFGAVRILDGGLESVREVITLEQLQNLLLEEKRDLQSLQSLITSNRQAFATDVVKIMVFSSMSLMRLSRDVASLGLAGLEFAAGIPATVGGAVCMNAGAHGSAMSEIISRVFLLTPDGKFLVLSKSELEFSYRHCSLPPDSLVLAAEIILQCEDSKTVLARRQNCLEYRRKTQPLSLPSAGSVFRNAIIQGETIAAGLLLEQAQMKGVGINGLEYSELHANWIVRHGKESHGKEDCDRENRSAQTADLKELIRLGQQKVFDQHGITLRPEIVIWE